MAERKLCEICGEPYGKGQGAKTKHYKAKHPVEHAANIAKMREGYKVKVLGIKPGSPDVPVVPVAAPEASGRTGGVDQEPILDEELAGDVQEDVDGQDDLQEDEPDDLADYFLRNTPPGNGNGNGHGREAPKAGSALPKSPRTTTVAAEAMGLILVPKVIQYSSIKPYQMFMLMVNEYGWPPTMPMPDFLDTILTVCAASWGHDLDKPYGKIPVQEAPQ